jgi:hypothetical protein
MGTLSESPNGVGALHETRGRKKIRQLAARDGWQCVWCSGQLTLETATLEHVIPRSRCSPRLHPDNLLLACHPCNVRRGCQPAVSWLEQLPSGQARVDLVEQALRRVWHSEEALLREKSVVECCYASGIANGPELVAHLLRQGAWQLEQSVEEVSALYLGIESAVAQEIAALSLEVAGATEQFQTRREFAIDYALRLPRRKRMTSFLIFEGRQEEARARLLLHHWGDHRRLSLTGGPTLTAA